MLSINPNPVAFTLPFTHHPVMWYGILFAMGLLLSLLQTKQFLLLKVPSSIKEAPHILTTLLDGVVFWSAAGILILARLFEIIFYSPEILNHGLDIFKIWEGGLSSHGGILGAGLGVCLGYYLGKDKWKSVKITLRDLLDCASASSGICACMIRLGNFINQEIVGYPTSMPWAVTFLHPVDGLEPVPRHPVQLYEGMAYALIWILASWRIRKKLPPLALFCETLIAIFTARLFLEFFKVPLVAGDNFSLLSTGQILSLPPLVALITYRWTLYKRKSSDLPTR